MKKLLITLLIVLMVIAIVPAVPVSAATALPDSDPRLISVKAYRNLLETADFLIIFEINIPYAVPPTDPVTETFIWELIDSDGVTVLGSTVGWPYEDDGYNFQLFSMYFDAAAGIVWDPALIYKLRLSGNPIAFVTPPTYIYDVTSSAYSTFTVTREVQDELALDVLIIAADLDLQWDLGLLLSLINDDETGQTLSTFGQAYFRGAIFGLQALAPALFPLAVSEIDLADRTWTDSYIATLEGQYAGTWVATAKAAGATLFGTSSDMLSLIMMFALVIGVFVGNIMVTGDHWNGAIDVSVVLIMTAKLSFYGLGYLGLIVAIAIIYLGMRIFKFP